MHLTVWWGGNKSTHPYHKGFEIKSRHRDSSVCVCDAGGGGGCQCVCGWGGWGGGFDIRLILNRSQDGMYGTDSGEG